MGKRFWSIALAGALIAGLFTILPAQAADGDAVKFFLSTPQGCGGDNPEILTIVDSDGETQCNTTASGVRNEIGSQTGTIGAAGNNVVSERDLATRRWDSVDGVPLTLDASRPISGQILTVGAFACAAPGCTPPASGGEVILDISLVGKQGDEEIELGTQTDEFEVAPGDDPHPTEVNIEPPESLTGTSFDAIELRTWVHGMSAGHGVIMTNGDPSSFISVPTGTAGPVVSEPPGKSDPPGKGKKKGCGKGKGKKKGACPGKKPPKPPAVAECPAYVPGEQGAEAETITVTDAATAEAPVVVEFDSGPGFTRDIITGLNAYNETTSVYHNVQVDSAAAEAGLYARIEFPDHHDYDLFLNHADGSRAAASGGTNTAPGVLSCGDGCTDGSNFEQVEGVRTADCAGYTSQTMSFLSTGGATKLILWLGEPTFDAAAPGGGESAMEMFYRVLGL